MGDHDQSVKHRSALYDVFLFTFIGLGSKKDQIGCGLSCCALCLPRLNFISLTFVGGQTI